MVASSPRGACFVLLAAPLPVRRHAGLSHVSGLAQPNRVCRTDGTTRIPGGVGSRSRVGPEAPAAGALGRFPAILTRPDPAGAGRNRLRATLLVAHDAPYRSLLAPCPQPVSAPSGWVRMVANRSKLKGANDRTRGTWRIDLPSQRRRGTDGMSLGATWLCRRVWPVGLVHSRSARSVAMTRLARPRQPRKARRAG